MKNGVKRRLVMVMGVITALLVAFCQFFFFTAPSISSKTTQKADMASCDDAPSSESQHKITLPTDSVISSIGIELNGEIFLLFEFIEKGDLGNQAHEERSIPLSRYLTTLIPRIISPNAP